jgi:hypothetical protein
MNINSDLGTTEDVGVEREDGRHCSRGFAIQCAHSER